MKTATTWTRLISSPEFIFLPTSRHFDRVSHRGNYSAAASKGAGNFREPFEQSDSMDNGKLAERGKPRFVASVRRLAREEEPSGGWNVIKKSRIFHRGWKNEPLVITNRVETSGGGRGLVACERIAQTFSRFGQAW